jgi:hypothetical protein
MQQLLISCHLATCGAWGAIGKRAHAALEIGYTRANCLFEISYLQVCHEIA